MTITNGVTEKLIGKTFSTVAEGIILYCYIDYLMFIGTSCRLFGLREDYAETLHLCRNCRCLFWKTYGHPCIETNNQSLDNNNSLNSESDPESYYVPVPPQAFLKFFSL